MELASADPRVHTAVVPALVAAVMIISSLLAQWFAPHNPFDLATLSLLDASLPTAWDEGGNAAPVAFASSTKTSSGGRLDIGSAFDADLDELIFQIIAIVAMVARLGEKP